MQKSSLKPKGFRGTKGHSSGGQLSRVTKPATKSGKTSSKGFPGAK